MPSPIPAVRAHAVEPRGAPRLLVGAACLFMSWAGCSGPETPRPEIWAVEPAEVPADARSLLLVRGRGFPDDDPLVALEDGGTVAYGYSVRRLSMSTIQVVVAGLSSGVYDVRVKFPGRASVALEQGLAVTPVADRPEDATPPDVWLVAPDPSQGLRPGTRVWVEIMARDPSGIARMGYFTEGRYETSITREVRAGGDTAWARFPLDVPPDMEPLHLFWLIPEAWDTKGNHGLSDYAESMVVCGDPGDGSPPWPCR